MRALLSVSDKRGLVEFARGLVDLGFELVSTGGTASALEQAGVRVVAVSAITNFPEILDGRVKTLHPNVHAGLLAIRDNPAHMRTLGENAIQVIDVLAVNLYPFARTLAAGGSHRDAIEQIDIGGPAMIRSAAKNAENVLVLVNPDDYDEALAALRAGGASNGFRNRLAAKAFAHTAAYDGLIAAYLAGAAGDLLPDEIAVPMTKLRALRYGENPHQQQAAFYQFGPPSLGAYGLASVEQLHGLELSYNNILDAAAAWELVSEFDAPAVAAIKHGNPCGLAVGDGPLAEIFRRAYEGDKVSIFGGIVAANRPLNAETAEAMRGILLDVIVAPDYEPEALASLRKRKTTRILKIPLAANRPLATLPLAALQFRSVAGGFLVQAPDRLPDASLRVEVVSRRQPTQAEMRDLLFAWRAVKHVRSNAIVLAKDSSLVGVGAGQMSRVDSVHMAVHRAGERAAGSVLASDAFFPFADGPELALKAGVGAIIEPGGSKRDPEVIAAVDRHGAALVFTSGERHFRH